METLTYTREERLAAALRALAPVGVGVAEATSRAAQQGIEVVPDLLCQTAGRTRTDAAFGDVPARLSVYVAGRLAGTVLGASPTAWTWVPGAASPSSAEALGHLRRTPAAAVLACAAHHADGA